MHAVNNAQLPIYKDKSDVICFTKAGLNTYAILNQRIRSQEKIILLMQ